MPIEHGVGQIALGFAHLNRRTEAARDYRHYQNNEALVNELIKHGKQFDQVAYPNRSHGIYEGEGTTRHLRHTMLRWWLTNMPAGAMDAEAVEKRRKNSPAGRIQRGSRGG